MAEVLLATNRWPCDGITTQRTISFSGGYIDRSHVRAFIEDDATRARLYEITITPDMWLSDTVITGLPAGAVGQNHLILRDTPKDAPLVDFLGRSRITEANLDKVARQAVFSAAETADLTQTDVLQAILASSGAAIASASQAASSAADALNSAAAADSAFDAFDDRYLGSKASDPTVDNDGNALQVGALYWNTNANEMRVWDGASWRAVVEVANAATKLQTARTLTIGNTGKAFDGSANVSWSLAEIGAARFGVLADGTNLNTVVAPGFYTLGVTIVNAPAGVEQGQLIVARGGLSTILQIVTGFYDGEIYWRQGNPPDTGGIGSWSAWHRFFHSGNLDPATYAPSGMVAYFARNTAPAGWLKANGAAVSRTTYAALFAAIGTTFGAGDGSTTFKLPDLRGEFLRGWDDGRGVDSGRAFGSAQAQDLQSHSHAQNGYVLVAGVNIPNNGSSSHLQITTANTGNTGGVETRPRNVALLACIKI